MEEEWSDCVEVYMMEEGWSDCVERLWRRSRVIVWKDDGGQDSGVE